jgi:hypothetical protein
MERRATEKCHIRSQAKWKSVLDPDDAPTGKRCD